MIKITCFSQHSPSSGFSSERFVCCKSVYIKHAATYALYKHSYSTQIFRMKNLMMANVG